MGKYIFRRLLQMVLVLLGSSVILFVCLFVLPGDPIGNMAGERARDPAVRAVLAKRYRLDEPLVAQYVHYMSKVSRGDLGTSFRLGRPVADVLDEKIGNTAKLAFAAIVVEAVIGIGAGIVSAVSRHSFWDVLVTTATTLAIGFPIFVIASLLQQAFAIKHQWLPLFGQEDGLRSYVLPAFSLAFTDAALVARLMRGSMLEVLDADYIRTAAAKGLSRRSIVMRHALRNSILPVLTYLGITFGSLIGGTLITEVIFNWDGIGSALGTAISAQDHPIVLGIVIYGVAIFVLVNLMVDVAYALLDPRVRLD